MARIQQPSASVNAKTPMNPAPESDPASRAPTGVLPLVGALSALAIVAAAFVYYQDEYDAGTDATVPQTTTSDNKAFTPAETATPLATESAPSTAPSATTAPETTSADEPRTHVVANAAPSVHANSAKHHPVAKASKPARALEPRNRQVVLATHPHPVYPLQALRSGEQGTVLVLAQIDVDGQVTDARVVRHSGSWTLDRAAPSEVRRWKFAPALHDGRPVVASVEVPVNYRLNQ